MANPSIGAYSFLSLSLMGFNYPGEELVDITRANVDGVAYTKTGTRGRPFSAASTVDVASAAAAKALALSYAGLVGTVVTLVDASGQSWTNVAVLDVVVGPVRAVVCMVGGLAISDGSDGYLIAARWTLQVCAEE